MKLARGLLLLGLLAIVAFGVAKESREPFLWLYVDDWLRPKPEPVEVAVGDGLAVRLYGDTRPHVGKVARLQKGLVLVVNGRERIEEGFGFGLPLVQVGGQAYLARSASVEQLGGRLVKRYVMDTVDTPSGFLRRKYEPVEPIGTVVVTYTLTAGAVEVAVDLAGLNEGWQGAYLMNEQGARTFTRYEEPGLAVEGEQLGRWEPTVGRRGCIVAADRSTQFCVETEQATQRYYGRERYRQYYWIGIYQLSWAGIDIEVPPSARQFAYRVVLERPGVE